MSLLFRNEEEEKAFEAGKDLALSCGFSEAALLDCSTIELSDAVRQMCEKNTCGMYAGNWACPDAEAWRSAEAGLADTAGAFWSRRSESWRTAWIMKE